MIEILNATDVRKEWGRFIDNVVRSKPSIVKRNRDYIAALSLEHMNIILSPYRFKMRYEKEDDGSFTGFLDGFDLVVNVDSLDELKSFLAIELMDYAEEYMKDFGKYYNAPNRKEHFPYILHVLIQENEKAVQNVIDA